MKEYYKLGLCEVAENGYVFTGEYSNNGYIFKDEEAFEKNWDAPCYVPEGEIELVDRCEFYTHNDLLKLCYNNHKLCDRIFFKLDWQYPETLLDDLDIHCDIQPYWDFVKEGAVVKWNDSSGENSGVYNVLSVPIPESNMLCDSWGSDTIVLIGNEVSQIEVNLCELEAYAFTDDELSDMLVNMYHFVDTVLIENEDELYTIAHEMFADNADTLERWYPFLKDCNTDSEMWYDEIRDDVVCEYMNKMNKDF